LCWLLHVVYKKLCCKQKVVMKIKSWFLAGMGHHNGGVNIVGGLIFGMAWALVNIEGLYTGGLYLEVYGITLYSVVWLNPVERMEKKAPKMTRNDDLQENTQMTAFVLTQGQLWAPLQIFQNKCLRMGSVQVYFLHFVF
jgi:hypothetical protein